MSRLDDFDLPAALRAEAALHTMWRPPLMILLVDAAAEIDSLREALVRIAARQNVVA